MVKFILNNKTIETDAPSGLTLVDFIRYNQHLTGTKIGCREGDCGACTVLIGKLINNKLVYESMTSCITPLGNANGKHVVTIEGLNMNGLTPVQNAMVENSGTQCGFCTPGFVVSLSGYCLSNEPVTLENVISSIDGNICRCTGYKSIERASEDIYKLLINKDIGNSVDWAVENEFVSSYFSKIKNRLANLEIENNTINNNNLFVGGGTDLYVQRHDEMTNSAIDFLLDNQYLKGIVIENEVCEIGAATTASELMNSDKLKSIIPNLRKYLKLISSTPIRNMGTIAGNFVNASPIGDLTAFFIALGSKIVLKNSSGNKRTLALKEFYKGYKTLDKSKDEFIEKICFSIPDKNTKFNFEKISKRTYLDIASVNSAMRIKVEENRIKEIHISAGGVAPTPLFLTKTCAFLKEKELSIETVNSSFEIAQSEITPISDARGDENYKRLALKQLILSHFLELFPEKLNIENFVTD